MGSRLGLQVGPGTLQKWPPRWPVSQCKSTLPLLGFRESLWTLLPLQLPPGAQTAGQSPGETTDRHTHASRNMAASREQLKKTGMLSTSLCFLELSKCPQSAKSAYGPNPSCKGVWERSVSHLPQDKETHCLEDGLPVV